MKYLITTLLCILGFCSNYVQAQKSSPAAKYRKTMEQTQLLFEGEVIKTTAYPNADSSRLYFSSVVRVNKVVKGQLTAGTVRVSYKGPRITKNAGGRPGTFAVVDDGHGSSDGEPALPSQTNILLFCRPLPSTYARNHTAKPAGAGPELEMIGLAPFYPNDSINSSVGGKFATKQALYQHLSTQYRITVPAPDVPKRATPLRNSAKDSIRREMEEIEKRARGIKKAKDLQRSQQKSLGILSPTGTERLTYSIQNPSVTGTTLRYLEYDVFISSSTGNSYLDAGAMEFSYRTDVFGTNLGTSGRVTATAAAGFNTSTYRAPVVFDGDGPAPSFRINFLTQSAVATRNRIRITSTPIQLLHIRIEMVSCGPNSGVEFTNDDDRAYLNLYTLTANAPNQTQYIDYYNPVVYTDYPGGIALCAPPVISNFPSSVRAGTDEIITVTGSGFGATRGTGQLQFKDANDGGSRYLLLDDFDYVSWSNTQIQVRVPSLVARGARTGGTGTPGSGTIKVTTNQGLSSESSTELTIEYARRQVQLLSTSTGAIVQKSPYLIAKLRCADGLTFRVDNTLKNDPAAIKCIEAALAVWSVRLNVYLALERNAQGQLVGQVSGAAQADGVNMLYYESFSGTQIEPLMRTYASQTRQCGNNFALKDTDIAFNVSTTWDYSLSGTTQGYSFYDAFLHELGHVLGAGHLVTPYVASTQQMELMYFGALPNTAASARRSITSGPGKSLSAVQAVISTSQGTSWCDPDLETLRAAGSATCRNTKPAAPGLIGQLVSGTKQVDLSWTSIYNATGYTVESSLQPTTGFTTLRQLNSPTFIQIRTAELTGSTTHYFRVRANNLAGASVISNVVSISTPANRGTSPIPEPTNLQVAAGAGTVNTLNWDYSMTGAYFIIRRSTSSDFSASTTTQFTTGTDARTWSDANTTAGTVYFYEIYAVVGGSQSFPPPPVSITVPGCTSLSAVPTITVQKAYLGDPSVCRFSINGVTGATNYVWILEAQDDNRGMGLTWSTYNDTPSSFVVRTAQSGYGTPSGETNLTVQVKSNCDEVVSRNLNYIEPNFQLVSEGTDFAAVEVQKTAFSVYPNPVQQHFRVELPKGWESASVRFVDLKSGQPIKQWQANATFLEANIAGVKPGIYILELLHQGQTKRQRLLVRE